MVVDRAGELFHPVGAVLKCCTAEQQRSAAARQGV
jgi:hypothetical protein